MSRTALVFPGQGSQEDGMRALVAEWRPELLDVLEDCVGRDPFDALASSTACAQPAILAASLAYWHAAGRPLGRFAVGHSLGELTALCVAGALAEEDAVRLAAVRGTLMQRASDEHPGCGMLAVRARADELQAIAEECGVTIANDNGPRQVVLSGSADGLARAAARLDALRMRSKRLPVAGAFHSPLMRSAVEPFRAALARVEFARPACVVYSAIRCRPFRDPASELADSLTSGVRWAGTIARLAGEEGVETFVEVGPGRGLTRLIERLVDRDAPGKVETIHARALS